MSIETCTNQRFTMFEKNDKILNFQVKDQDGNAVDISDALASIFAMFNASTGVEVFRATLGDGITVATSVVTVTIPNDASGITTGGYLFELQLTDSGDNVNTVAQGSATVKESYIL